MRGIFLLLALATASTVATANDEDCVETVKTYKNIDIVVSSKDSCVSVQCFNVSARNIQSALALCHQTEKDYSYCGWHGSKRIDNVTIDMGPKSEYSVVLTKCHT